MDRRAFVASGIACLAAPRAAAPAPAKTIRRIGVLEMADAVSNAANLSALRQGLAEHGYVEGQNVVIEYRSADGRTERLPDLAVELVRLGPDAIVTRGDPAALAAKHATATIPIVMASSGDPAASGIVRSLARPGGNVTGLHTMAPPELGGTRLQLLKEMMPGLARVAVLWNSGDIYAPFVTRATEMAAGTMRVRLTSLPVQNPWDFDRAFEAALMGQPDALITIDGHLTVSHRTRIVDFAAMSRLPAIYGLREFADAGGLVAYGTDRRDLFRRSAGFVHRILVGARPADLPIEAPTKFELVINLKTARALGVTIPPSLLQRADQVIGS